MKFFGQALAQRVLLTQAGAASVQRRRPSWSPVRGGLRAR